MSSQIDKQSSMPPLPPPLPTPLMAASDVLIPDDKRSPAAQRSSIMLSPPPSPFANTDNTARADPPLFSSHGLSDLRAAMFRPLVDVVRQNGVVAAAIEASSPKGDSKESDNNYSEYFQSTVYEQYAKSPRRWLAAQREMLKLYKPQIATVISVTATQPPASAPTPRPSRVIKPRPQIQSPSGGMTTRNSAPSSPRIVSKKVRPLNVSPTVFTLPTAQKRSSLSPESSPRMSTVHDIDLDDVPDFCPPLSSLDGTKGMRTDWKGNAMDLSDDPDRELLHPYELQLASVLRLPCAMYLDSKKRIFAERVFRARKGLQFRRTDSQKACRIDVNKATRLFVAFERVGWFDDKWLSPYL
ncbi:uncharacterized protein V1513DRAFT_445543 [Lipomyces chichibuensis]|uniref:uncharacterized protein n=1 Tax=Lipomyces chichibuensis TaxID=1546026 RepID=UPI003343AB00